MVYRCWKDFYGVESEKYFNSDVNTDLTTSELLQYGTISLLSL